VRQTISKIWLSLESPVGLENHRETMFPEMVVATRSPFMLVVFIGFFLFFWLVLVEILCLLNVPIMLPIPPRVFAGSGRIGGGVKGRGRGSPSPLRVRRPDR